MKIKQIHSVLLFLSMLAFVPMSHAAFITATNSGNWSDTNKNFVVDCDILNPAAQTVAGGDTCGALIGDALNFGQAGGSTRVNPALLKGWGVRPVDWQWGINVAQELAPRVSLEVGYNRRWWGNYTVTDNTLVKPEDYEKWTILAPSDSRLPGGGTAARSHPSGAGRRHAGRLNRRGPVGLVRS